jgi:hypothetical protein
MTWRGVYSGATTYATNDAVSYQGSAYIATEGTTGVAPKTTAPWSVLVTLVPASVSASFVPTVGAPTNGVLVANTLYLQPIFVPYAATLTGVVWGNNETVTGNVIGSLYSAGLERAAKTTSVVMAGAYNTQAQAFESTYAAAAGVYYIGFQASSASAKFNKREIMGQWSAQAQGGFAAPATISALTAPGTGSTSPEVGTY